MFTKFVNAWKNFWFKEQSPEPIGLLRIFFGLFVLQLGLVELAPNFSVLFAVRSMFDTASVAAHWWQRDPVFDLFLLLPQDDNLRFGFFCLFLLFAFFLTIGFCTRLSAIVVYLCLLTFDRQCPFILDAGDDFMRILSFLLIFSPAAEAFSMDRFLKAKMQGKALKDMPPVMVSPWVQRMIQLQISIVYACAVLPKIFGEQWQAGTSVYYALKLTDFAKFPLPAILTQFPFYKILTYYTLVTEFCMATLVWIRPLRYWILLAAVLMHLAIDWAMNLPTFEWLFISSYIVFVEPDDLKKLLTVLRSCLGFKPKQTNTLKAKRLEQYNFLFLPTLLLLLTILIVGSALAKPIRDQYVLLESQRDYSRRLSKVSTYWYERLEQCANLPETDDRKLSAEEALGVILSLSSDYPEASKLLRKSCQGRAEQNKAYNPELISSLSSLANLYLETGHFEACELCYKTILNYDIDHLKYAPGRQSIELNNLGVLAYFRALSAKNKAEQSQMYTKADTFFRQALNKLHNPKERSVSGFREAAADILLNEYLALRDLDRLKEAGRARGKATELSSGDKKISLPLSRIYSILTKNRD